MAAKVLIIDGDISLSTVLSDYLASRGYKAQAISNGKAGLDALSAEHWDLLLMELQGLGIDCSSRGGEENRVLRIRGLHLLEVGRHSREREGNRRKGIPMVHFPVIGRPPRGADGHPRAPLPQVFQAGVRPDSVQRDRNRPGCVR